MNPGRYQLPQHVSGDRLRARRHTLAIERERFEWYRRDDEEDDPQIRDGAVRLLPPTVRRLPRDYDFPASMTAALVADTARTSAIELLCGVSTTLSPLRDERGYRRLYYLLGGTADVTSRWKEDAEFGRQRMTGVNPMHLRRCPPDSPGVPSPVRDPELRRAAAYVLDRLHAARAAWSFDEAARTKRLFYTDYSVLWHPRIQECLQPRAFLAAPTCLFWADETGALAPLAIQLKPQGEPANPVFTPLHPFADWMMARAHAQSADAHVHESPYHLLETHLVNGVIATAMYRELHPHHPLRQLLAPHYEYTLAINKMADTNLLRRDGSIDNGLSARVRGALRAAQLFYTGWSWERRTLEADLEDRGVGRDVLPQYYYRDDAERVNDAIRAYVTSILGLWYRGDEDVRADTELAAFVDAVADERQGAVPGFPRRVDTFHRLRHLVAEMIFRAGPQHAAVNNGQFDAYGWILGTPGTVTAPLPEEAWAVGDGDPTRQVFSEPALWAAMPDPKPALGQMGMVWILSRPTRRSLLQSGDSPAFHPRRCQEADDIIGAFRRRLHAISEAVQRRNERIQRPYRYLDPLNISRSTDI